MSDVREAKLWDWRDDAETLNFTDIEECLEDFVEHHEGTVPETVKLYGYAEMVPSVPVLSDHILSYFLEDILDDTFGNPDEYTKATQGMKDASKRFVEEVLKEYKVYMCEIVERKIVTIRDYITVEEEQECVCGESYCPVCGEDYDDE